MKHRFIVHAELRLATAMRAEELVLTALQLREGSLSAAQQHPAAQALAALCASLRVQLGKCREIFGDPPEDQEP